MKIKDCYKYFSKYCPFFWKDISRNLAENILSQKPVGSFLLRSNEDEVEDELLFAISYVYGEKTNSMIKHGHILFLSDCFLSSGAHWICINTIGLEHAENDCGADVLFQAINRFDWNNTRISLRHLAVESILKCMTNMPREITHLHLLGICEEQIFKLCLPNNLKEEIFGIYLTEWAKFCCLGILPDLC